jgi:HNH endonuclease
VSGKGKKCDATEFLELDHIEPFALGGKTEASNVRVLCRVHNQLAAEERGLTRNQSADEVC